MSLFHLEKGRLEISVGEGGHQDCQPKWQRHAQPDGYVVPQETVLDCGCHHWIDDEASREVNHEIVIHIEAERNSPQIDRPPRKILRICAKESKKKKHAAEDAK